jgi:hypothetical protein
MTGTHLLQKAVDSYSEQHRIVCFVRNPTKIPEALRSKVEIVQGDFTNAADVKACIKTTAPDSIVITTSVGFTNTLVALNQILVPFIVEALTECNRLGACKLIYLSGAGSPNPPSREYGWFFSLIMFGVKLKGAVYDNTATQEYIVATDPSLRFAIVKMGMVSEGASKGTIVSKQCTDDMTWGFTDIVMTEGVQFCDVGAFLLRLATEADGCRGRELLVMRYAAPTTK